MNHETEYLEREISAEFLFGAKSQVETTVRRDIKPGALAQIVEEASGLFLDGCRRIMVPVDPRDEDVTDVHLTLRYWHLTEDDLSMIDLQVSACEIPKPGELSKALEKLARKLVPQFMDVLFKQGINLPK